MSIENDNLEKKFGRKNPFTVPEGYFENFASGFMNSLPDDENHVIRASVPKRRDIYVWSSMAAACVVGILFALVSLFKPDRTDMASQLSKTDNVSAVNAVSGNQTDLDMMADYLMIDNEDIYAYVSEY